MLAQVCMVVVGKQANGLNEFCGELVVPGTNRCKAHQGQPTESPKPASRRKRPVKSEGK